MEQGIDGGRAVGGLGCAVVAVAVVLLVAVGLVAFQEIEDSRANRAQARASAEWARVAAIEANTARDREANVHREQMFQMWTVALSSNSGLLVVMSAALGAGGAWAVMRWLVRQEVF